VAAEIARAKDDHARARALLDRALACPASEPQKRFLERKRAELEIRLSG
jgi:hypothetical protein